MCYDEDNRRADTAQKESKMKKGAINAKNEIVVADWFKKKSGLIYSSIFVITSKTEKAVYAYDMFGKFVWIPKSTLSYYDENGDVDNARLDEAINSVMSKCKKFGQTEERETREYNEELSEQVKYGGAYGKIVD
jgi:hypothetical protein